MGGPTRCKLHNGHDGSHDDGAITWVDRPAAGVEARSEGRIDYDGADACGPQPGAVQRVVPVDGGDIEVWVDDHAHRYSPTSRIASLESDLARNRADADRLATELGAVRREHGACAVERDVCKGVADAALAKVAALEAQLAEAKQSAGAWQTAYDAEKDGLSHERIHELERALDASAETVRRLEGRLANAAYDAAKLDASTERNRKLTEAAKLARSALLESTGPMRNAKTATALSAIDAALSVPTAAAPPMASDEALTTVAKLRAEQEQAAERLAPVLARYAPTADVPGQVRCLDCASLSSAEPIALIVPRTQWLRIHPDDGGYLCAHCMLVRAAKLPGAVNITGVITLGTDYDAGGEHPYDWVTRRVDPTATPLYAKPADASRAVEETAKEAGLEEVWWCLEPTCGYRRATHRMTYRCRHWKLQSQSCAEHACQLCEPLPSAAPAPAASTGEKEGT
jgi:hypothetical protein